MTRHNATAGPIYEFEGHLPDIGPDVYVAPTAAIIGNVRIGAGSSVWFSAVVRGDDMPIVIGRGTNIQDGAIVHGTEEIAATHIGDNVVIGHGAILHGCRIEDGAMIGMGAVVLDAAIVGSGAIVAAGAIVPPGKQVPPDSLWVAGSVKRKVTAQERAFLDYAPPHYRNRAAQYRARAAVGLTLGANHGR